MVTSNHVNIYYCVVMHQVKNICLNIGIDVLKIIALYSFYILFDRF